MAFTIQNPPYLMEQKIMNFGQDSASWISLWRWRFYQRSCYIIEFGTIIIVHFVVKIEFWHIRKLLRPFLND